MQQARITAASARHGMPMEYLMTTSCQDGEGACVNAAGGAEVQSTHAWSTAWIDACKNVTKI
jgi:hypothetical protein